MDIKIKSQSLPERCEICHKNDCFNASTGYCSRCSVIVRPNTVMTRPTTSNDLLEGEFIKGVGHRPLGQPTGVGRIGRQVRQPLGLDVDREPHRLRLRQDWYDGKIFSFFAFFAAIWDFVVLIFWGNFLADIIQSGDLSKASQLLVLMPHTIVGISIAYYVITMYLNSTLITVTGKTLTVEHNPLPWWGNRSLSTSDIDQLYSKQGATMRSGSEVTHYYDLYAKLKSGKDIKLIGSLGSTEVALFLEQQIEQYLGIVDRPVPGEIPK